MQVPKCKCYEVNCILRVRVVFWVKVVLSLNKLRINYIFLYKYKVAIDFFLNIYLGKLPRQNFMAGFRGGLFIQYKARKS